MLQKFVNLIALVQTLLTVPPDDYDEIDAKVKEYEAAKQDIKQFHGDHELANPQVISELDGLVKTARAASVDQNEIDAIVAEQDENKPEKSAPTEEKETAEQLAGKNSTAELQAIADKEEVDMSGTKNKTEMAARIIEARQRV